MNEMTQTSTAVSYETDIKPLFREKDRQAMSGRFDLWSYDDVSRYATPIVARLRSGTMPCMGRGHRLRSTCSGVGSIRASSRNSWMAVLAPAIGPPRRGRRVAAGA